MKFAIKRRWSGEVMFECELTAEIAVKSYRLQLGFAVKKAVRACDGRSKVGLCENRRRAEKHRPEPQCRSIHF